ADVFAPSEARRLFALVAAGASAGGLVGPVLTTLLVGPLGHGGLLLLSSLLIGASAATALWLHRWRDRNPLPASERAAVPPRPASGPRCHRRSGWAAIRWRARSMCSARPTCWASRCSWCC